MSKSRGQRQVDRSRNQIKRALKELLSTKNYGDISVGLITQNADVGRSTFYRHFNNKADVLIALHEDIFGEVFLKMFSPADWTADRPSGELQSLFSKHLTSVNMNMSLVDDIGADLDYIMRNIIALLANIIEQGLEHAFKSIKTGIPFPVIASSVAGIYTMIFMSWRTSFPMIQGEELSKYVHSLSKAAILEGIKIDNHQENINIKPN